MLKIIRLRPFTVKDLQYVVLIKPFEDAGLVEEFPNDPAEEIELVSDICDNYSCNYYHFNHILTHTGANETPSTLFRHLHARDDYIPTLLICRQDGQRRKDIHAIKNYHELQSLLGLASDHGYVTGAKRLL